MNKECVTLQSLEKDSVKVELSNVVQDYRGECNYSELEQTTQVKEYNKQARNPGYMSIMRTDESVSELG